MYQLYIIIIYVYYYMYQVYINIIYICYVIFHHIVFVVVYLHRHYSYVIVFWSVMQKYGLKFELELFQACLFVENLVLTQFKFDSGLSRVFLKIWQTPESHERFYFIFANHLGHIGDQSLLSLIPRVFADDQLLASIFPVSVLASIFSFSFLFHP